jgi:hypothetical protein
MVRSGADVIKVAMSGSVTQPDAEHRQIADDEIAEIVAEAERPNVSCGWRMRMVHVLRIQPPARGYGASSTGSSWTRRRLR